jgi:hypothetical protein
MSRRTRNLVAVALGLAMLVSACTSTTTTTTTAGQGPTTTAGPGTTVPGVTTTSTLPDLSDLDVPEVVREQLEELIITAQEIRQLPFLTTPTITVVDDAGLRARVAEMLEESMEDIDADQALYRLLGLLPGDADLEQIIRNLYTEQVAGFYDGERGEIVVPARPDGFSLLQQGTMVHELVHALTDQHFDFNTTRTELIDAELYDQASALLSLIEGDAMFSELQWVQALSQRELGQYIGESLAVDRSALDATPQFIVESLLFPYEMGLVFVQTLHRSGGWAEVNAAYQTMPGLPGSTEQIITPGNFGRDLPVEIDPIPVVIPGYELVTTSVWGELGFRLMFNQVLGETASFRAASGWGGDFYHQWFDGSRAALLIVYTGDTANDIEEMRAALIEYRRQAVPESAFVWVAVRGDRLFFIAADDPEVGALLRTEMGLD